MKKILIAIAILLIPTFGFAWSWSGGGGGSGDVTKSGTTTAGQIACWGTGDDPTTIVSCGAKTTYTEPAADAVICRISAGNTGACDAGTDIGSATAEMGDLYIGTGKEIKMLDDQSVKLAPTTGLLTLTGAFATTGYMQGGIKINSDANGMTGAEMSAAGMYGTLFIATGAGTWTLPTAVEGMSACLKDSGGSAHDLILDVQADDDISLDGDTELTNGTGITNASGSSKGDFVCVIAISAGHWVTLGTKGTWASQ
jgi:hypothetical protein